MFLNWNLEPPNTPNTIIIILKYLIQYNDCILKPPYRNTSQLYIWVCLSSSCPKRTVALSQCILLCPRSGNWSQSLRLTWICWLLKGSWTRPSCARGWIFRRPSRGLLRYVPSATRGQTWNLFKSRVELCFLKEKKKRRKNEMTEIRIWLPHYWE